MVFFLVKLKCQRSTKTSAVCAKYSTRDRILWR